MDCPYTQQNWTHIKTWTHYLWSPGLKRKPWMSRLEVCPRFACLYACVCPHLQVINKLAYTSCTTLSYSLPDETSSAAMNKPLGNFKYNIMCLVSRESKIYTQAMFRRGFLVGVKFYYTTIKIPQIFILTWPCVHMSLMQGRSGQFTTTFVVINAGGGGGGGRVSSRKW